MIVNSGIGVGLSAFEITPPPGVQMAGFAARKLPASGVHDPLYVRALVVDEEHGAVTALVVADVVSLPPRETSAIRESVERELGIPSGCVIVATTHTHGGPVTDDRGHSAAQAHDYVARIREAAVKAVAEARRKSVSARMVLGFGHEADVGKNRRRAGGVIDPAVPTIRIEDVDGRVIGILCCYACHPVTLGPDNALITADYPGEVVRSLEAVYPGAVAMFVTGCAGQINTGHSAEASLSIRSSEYRSFKEMTRLGRAVAGAAVQAAEHAAGSRGAPRGRAPGAGDETQVSAVTVEVPAPREPVPGADDFRARAREWLDEADLLRPDSPDFETERDRLLRWAAWAERMAAEIPHDSVVLLDVTAMRWGDIYLVGLPGEPFVEFGLEIRQRTSADVVVIGYANGCPGYVPHRSAYPEGGYEVLHAHKGYGAPSAFAPEAGERLVDAAVKALRQLGLSHVVTESQTAGHARIGVSNP